MSDTSDTHGDEKGAIFNTFVRLSDTLVDHYDIIEFLHFLTERCVELSEVDEAAVMLTAPSGHLQAIASSSERSQLLELFELQNRDGPCLDLVESGAVVTSPDLSHASVTDGRRSHPRHLLLVSGRCTASR